MTLLLCTATLWFLLQALLHILTGATIGVAFITAGAPDGTSAALRLLPLVALLAPALPLGGWLRGERRAQRSATLALVAGVAQAALPEPWRTLAAVVAFAGGSWFLIGIVGVANRRALAGGLAGAFLLRELVRHAGGTSALPGTGTMVFAATVAVAGFAALVAWGGAPEEMRGDSFERRSGGFRLRGALALGAILFFEAAFGIGVRSGMSPIGAAASMAVAAAAWLLVVRGLDVPRHRSLAVALSTIVVLCALLLPTEPARSMLVEVLAVFGHAAALLLLDRALAPASGRRSGGNLAAGLALVAVLTLVRAVIWSVAPLHSPSLLLASVPLLTAGLVLVVTMYLTPRPAHAEPALGLRSALLIAAVVPILAAILASR